MSLMVVIYIQAEISYIYTYILHTEMEIYLYIYGIHTVMKYIQGDHLHVFTFQM